MRISEIFETRIEEKIEPVIKVAERQDELKLASEIASYVVTPTIEVYVDDFLEHFTDTLRTSTTEIGVWISGYFGSGKSHLAKIIALLLENRTLQGVPASKRFEPRLPSDAAHRASILRSLTRIPQCDTQVLAFNINTLADSKSTPLARILVSQFYISKGYGSNFIYARVIEAELDKRGKLEQLHSAVERLAKKPWREIQRNLNFYSKALYQAVCEVAPELFNSPDDVAQALRSAEKGELYNVQFLVETILADVTMREKEVGKQCRMVLVLDESGQWIEDDAGRLAQLQSLVEEAAVRGQGKLWVLVTTHEDMGSIYQNARAIQGDMKKIEGRFRFKFSLTTENIELVLEDRLFRKNLAGKAEVARAYNQNPGVLRDLGQLAETSQKLPMCTEERFVTFYPFFPFHIHLIPEIVKSLRHAGGRGEQLSGSTRTLLAITQDILRAGRRKYLDKAVGELVSFDEVYNNLAGEAEVSPDVRRELSRIQDVVPESTELTRRVAEVLFLIREITYIPRTIDNIARLLAEHTTDDLPTIITHIRPELDKLIKAKLAAKIAEEYEFLTGERRTFEEEVGQDKIDLRWQDLEAGLAKFATENTIGFRTIAFKGKEFEVRILFDGTVVAKDGFTDIRISSPLAALAGKKVSDLEDQSLRPEEQQTIFVLSDRIPGFDDQLRYYLAMRAVIDRWKGDPHKSDEAHRLAAERESNDLTRLRGKVQDAIRDGLKRACVVFRGSARTVSPKDRQSPGETLRAEIASFWPNIYPKYEKVPVRIVNEQRAIPDVLKGAKDLATDVAELKLFDKAGQLNSQSPLLDTMRIFLSTRQSTNTRTLGRDVTTEFERPPYGWDPCALRVGVAALVRVGAVQILINKKPFTNPADSELQDALRVGRNFEKVELVLEDAQLEQDVLTEVRTLLIRLTGKRKIDETPAALATEMESYGKDVLEKAGEVSLWSGAAGFPLSETFRSGHEIFEKIVALTNPIHRTREIHAQKGRLEEYAAQIIAMSAFVSKWGKVFIEMRDSATNLSAVEHLLPSGGKSSTFLNNWNTAAQNATIAANWTGLQDARAAAELEMGSLMAEWREEARRVIQDGLDGLPELILIGGLPAAEFQDKLSSPLRTLLGLVDTETNPARVAALRHNAVLRVQRMKDTLHDEIHKRKDEPSPVRPLKRIRLAEVAATVRIESEAQWNLIRNRLDENVKRELDAGNDVEIG